MGQRIARLREAKGWSQSELARLLGLTRASVHQWENGTTQNIKLASFLRLVDLFGTDPAYLIWGADRKPAAAQPAPARLPRQKDN